MHQISCVSLKRPRDLRITDKCFEAKTKKKLTKNIMHTHNTQMDVWKPRNKWRLFGTSDDEKRTTKSIIE